MGDGSVAGHLQVACMKHLCSLLHFFCDLSCPENVAREFLQEARSSFPWWDWLEFQRNKQGTCHGVRPSAFIRGNLRRDCGSHPGGYFTGEGNPSQLAPHEGMGMELI